MTKIYRLEHKTLKLGPYFSLEEGWENLSDDAYLLCQLLGLKHGVDNKHPGISDFPLGRLPIDSCYFGCLSKEELKDWFGDFYQALLDTEEFVVNTYEVEDNSYVIGNSHRQVCFNREMAHIV